MLSMWVKLNVTCDDWDWGLGTGDWGLGTGESIIRLFMPTYLVISFSAYLWFK